MHPLIDFESDFEIVSFFVIVFSHDSVLVVKQSSLFYHVLFVGIILLCNPEPSCHGFVRSSSRGTQITHDQRCVRVSASPAILHFAHTGAAITTPLVAIITLLI
jgi:hypothetical protein